MKLYKNTAKIFKYDLNHFNIYLVLNYISDLLRMIFDIPL